MKPVSLPRVLFVLLLCALMLMLAPAALAGGGTTIRTCDEAGLDAALAEGGSNAFSCTTATTIVVSATKNVPLNTVLNGGGRLTLSGGHVRGVFNVPAGVTATFWSMTIRDGSARNGGAIISLGSLVINDVYFLDNKASGSGGAISFVGPGLTIANSTFSGNKASGSDNTMGGALYLASGTGLTITNSTFYNNSAQRGGAILTTDSDLTLTILATTFAGNSTSNPYGGTAIFNSVGTVTLRNTLLDTAAGRNCNGAIVDGGHNLQHGGEANSCGTAAVTGSPHLGPLAYNGGPTPTMALLPGSPAIDQIPAAECVVKADQRGRLRPAYGQTSNACDIGAFEVQQARYLPGIMR